MGNNTIIPGSLCPHCGYFADMAASTGGKAKPTPGDFTLCINCGALNAFDAGMKLVKVLDAQIEELSGRQQLMIRLSQAFIRNRGPLKRLKDEKPS